MCKHTHTQSLARETRSKAESTWRQQVSRFVAQQAGCRGMHRPKVLPGLVSGCLTQGPETENTGGVWLPPCCQPGPQGATSTHPCNRWPRRGKPRQSLPPLPQLSPATHRAGQVGHWWFVCVLGCIHPFSLTGSGSISGVKSSQIFACCSHTGCLVYLPCGWMMTLCRSRKYTFLLFHLSMNHTDWLRWCSGSRCVFIY